jgi:signal transduction histidine kinase
MKFRIKSQYILGSILLVLLLLMIALVLLLNRNANQTKQEMMERSRHLAHQRFETLIKLLQRNKNLIINDYTFWDEMVLFTKQRDLEWGKDNIITMLTNYHFDFSRVYSSNKENIDNYAIKNGNISDGVIDLNELDYFLQNPGTYHWYTVVNNQVVELFGATIHKTDDPEHKTDPSGFFLAGNLIDSVYLNELSQLIEGQVIVVMNNSKRAVNLDSDNIMGSLPLNNKDGQIIAYLQLRNNPEFLSLFQTSTRHVLLLSLISAVVIMLIFYFLLIRLIGYPLRTISQILTNKKGLTKAQKLKKFGFEFSQISDLIVQSFKQQEQLLYLKEKAEESDRLKSTFLANMSHEIRTPINGLIGFSELIGHADTTPEQHTEFQKIMKSCAKDLMHIMDDIIEISKIDAGEIKLRNQSISIALLFNELDMLFSQQIKMKEKRIHLIVVPPKNNILLVIDGYRLKQILSILLDNAVKFTDKGHVELTYQYTPPNITFRVKDTGIGIRKEKQEIIFEQFRQSEEHLARSHGGNGLGLAILKKLTGMMNGTITLESEVGKGTIFKVIFPIDNRDLSDSIGDFPK